MQSVAPAWSAHQASRIIPTATALPGSFEIGALSIIIGQRDTHHGDFVAANTTVSDLPRALPLYERPVSADRRHGNAAAASR